MEPSRECIGQPRLQLVDARIPTRLGDAERTLGGVECHERRGVVIQAWPQHRGTTGRRGAQLLSIHFELEERPMYLMIGMW